jgi:hypothetical protein
VRTLHPVLKEYFDDRLKTVGTSNPRELLIASALACVGVAEQGGDNRGPIVELFQQTVGRAEGQSWCMDFLQSCIAYVELATGLSCPLPSAEHVLALWNQSKVYSAVQPAQAGDLIIWRFGNTPSGHCGLIVGVDTLRYQTVEGNTSPSGEIESNGDGVYLKHRAKGGSKSFVEVGFLRCFP